MTAPITPRASNGWDQWRAHVLAELERLADNDQRAEAQLVAIRGDLAKLHAEVASLRTLAGIGGAVAGLLAGVVVRLVEAGLHLP